MENKAKLRTALIMFCSLLLVGLLYTVITHGRISITNLGDTTIEIIKLDGAERGDIVEVKNGAFLKSGSYIIRNTASGVDRMAQVTIPRWLQAAQLTYQQPQTAKTSRLAGLTYENFFKADSGSLVSFTDLSEYTPGYTIHPADDVFGGKYSDVGMAEALFSPVNTRDGKLVGFHDTELLTYSFATRQFTPFGDGRIAYPGREAIEEDVTLIPKLKRSSDLASNRVVIYEKSAKKLRMIDGTNKTEAYDVTIANPRSVTFDGNAKGFAFVNTSTDITTDAEKDEEDNDLTYEATIYHTDTKQTMQVDVGSAKVVADIALSPSGGMVATIKDGELWVYEVSSGDVVMANPFTNINRLYWKGTTLYALSNDSGMNVYDSGTRQLLSMDLGDDDDIVFSNFIPVGDRLYATAYNTKQDSQLPDGYGIDLDTKSDGITESLARQLPYRDDDLEINYLGNTIYVRINYYPRNGNSTEAQQELATLKSRANDKLKEMFGTELLKKTTVRFIN